MQSTAHQGWEPSVPVAVLLVRFCSSVQGRTVVGRGHQVSGTPEQPVQIVLKTMMAALPFVDSFPIVGMVTNQIRVLSL